jgi:hypothetical protein
LTLTANTLNPVPGTWTLVVEFSEPIVGDEVSQPFSGNIELNATSASAAGLPDSASTTLAAGTPVTVPVTVTNNGAAPEDFFVDPRLDASSTITLAPFDQTTDLPLPMVSNFPTWFVPTETSNVSVTQSSTLPAMFDYGPFAGDPDLPSSSVGPGPLCSTSESASYTPAGGTVTPGFWSAGPTECGPYAGPAPTGAVTIGMTVQTKEFDPAVTSTTGDVWLASVNPAAAFSPIALNPGQSAVIDVTITPAGTSGTQVNGNLYVDDYTPGIPPYGQVAGNELVAIPYSYTIG